MTREIPRYSWTQPCCLSCWTRLNPYRVATRTKDITAEKCVHCGFPTVSGIYVRIDPATAKFPSLVKE